MIQKDIYSYGHIDSQDKFEETKLPSENAFGSKLNLKRISDNNHEHAQKIWNIKEKKNPSLLFRHLLETDVLLLADVFKTFRNKGVKHYNLDPAHF